MSDDSIVQFFRNKNDAVYSQIITEFMAHLDNGADFEETCHQSYEDEY